ncbi:MAG: hypothetical protein ACO2PN_19945 [Pyrobaculum sp.]
MPPINKQVKTKENKEKKTVKAVALALLLIVALAAFVEAQQNGTRPGGRAVNMTNVDQALGGFKDIAKWVVLGVRTVIAMAFWVAFAVVVAHFALGKVSPTRFQRMGSFWDGLERAKDIIYGYAWLFLLILAIYTVIGIVGNDNRLGPDTVGTVVKWIMIDPLVDLFNELQRPGQGTGQGTGQ